MGYSTMDIDIKKALRMASNGKVVSASNIDFFYPSYRRLWQRRVVRAELSTDRFNDKDCIFFLLDNKYQGNQFVEIEVIKGIENE